MLKRLELSYPAFARFKLVPQRPKLFFGKMPHSLRICDKILIETAEKIQLFLFRFHDAAIAISYGLNNQIGSLNTCNRLVYRRISLIQDLF